MPSMYEQIGNWCVHFTGIDKEKCDAGMAYCNFGQNFKNMPCIKRNDVPAGVCPLRRFPTHEEISAEVEMREKHSKELKEITPLITSMKIRFKGIGGTEKHKCPTCGGELTITVSACNGHTRGCCSTADCHCWIE